MNRSCVPLGNELQNDVEIEYLFSFLLCSSLLLQGLLACGVKERVVRCPNTLLTQLTQVTGDKYFQRVEKAGSIISK